MNIYTNADYDQAVNTIRRYAPQFPKTAIVLGTGLGPLAQLIDNAIAIPYSDIPGFPVSTVHGHSGRLLIGTLDGVPVAMQQGRAHFYEGYHPQQVVFAVRVLARLGIENLILTNAAGGVNSAYQAGDIMLINDHLYFPGFAGFSPLVGAHDEAFGARFVGMAKAYDGELRRLAKSVAAAAGVALHEGVYACVAGPHFETPAEIRMLRLIGADAVGMSTAPEVIAARQANVRVLAFSGITNVCIDTIDAETDVSHEQVLDVGAAIVPRLVALVRGVVSQLATA